MSGESPLEHYGAMLRLAEEQLTLVSDGEIEKLQALTARWDELALAMPAHPPAEAAPLLRRASQLSERLHDELQRVRDSLVSEIAMSARAGRAARGYALQAAPQGRQVDHCA